MENQYWVQREGKTSGGRWRGDIWYDDREQRIDMPIKPNRLQILSFVAGCVLIVLPAFLCGCNSKTDVSDEEGEACINTIVECKKAIALNPDDADAYFNMGSAYVSLKQYAEAVVAYKKTIAIKPSFFRAYNGLGNAYSNLGQHNNSDIAYATGIKLCKMAISWKPNNIEAHVCMAAAYWNLERSVESIIACKKLIALEPNTTARSSHDLSGTHEFN